MGAQQPFLYDKESFDDARFPTTTFDPKAVTRASWEVKPKKPKQEGPLISFNQHPDSHVVLGPRSAFKGMGRKTKNAIKWMRLVQLTIRVLQLGGAAGLLVLMVLIDKIDTLQGWIMRITPGVVAIHCVYGIYHLSRPAGGRSPASSAAYQLFSGFSDLGALALYAFGCLATRNYSSTWTTRLSNQGLVDIFVPTIYYLFIGAGGLHFITLCIAAWLGLVFRRITKMPPDMNPLEDHLTARTKHKRNKSSMTISTVSEGEKRLSTPLEDHRRSGAPYEALSRPPSIPFMHTRTGSRDSIGTRDSRIDLPSRQYQIQSTQSPRSSMASSDMKRMSAPPPRSSYRSSYNATYTEIPLHETNSGHAQQSPRPSISSRPSSVSPQKYKQPSQHSQQQQQQQQPPRPAKFTEAWYASESLISRTQQRKRAQLQAEREKAQSAAEAKLANRRSAYEALSQRYDFDASSDDDNDNENASGIYGGAQDRHQQQHGLDPESDTDPDRSGDDKYGRNSHPNPLRSNPATVAPPAPPAHGGGGRRPKTPFRPRDAALAELSANPRTASGSHDIADEGLSPAGPAGGPPGWQPRQRDSSIQPEDAFYSKPYGELKPATPPVMQAVGAGRQVSSGTDYGALGSGPGSGSVGSMYAAVFGRRNVSGKVAEEGLAGRRYSRYSVLNDD